MKKTCIPALIFLALLLLPFCRTAAATESITLDRQALEEIFIQIQRSTSPWPAEDLVITNFSSTPAMMQVPRGDIGYALLNQNHGRYLGKKSISVRITVAGINQGQVKMEGDLELYGDVVILTRRLARGETVGSEDLTVARHNITTFSQELVASPQEALGQSARTSLQAGTILLSRSLKKPAVVQRGDLVTITAGTKSLQVSTKGEARSQGAEGDMIQVKNINSREIITVRVVEQGLVRVDF